MCAYTGRIGSIRAAIPHEGTPGPVIGFLQESPCWWDHWLKGIERGLMDEPMYRMWMQESVPPQLLCEERPGRWVAESLWPSSRIIWKRLALEPARLDNSQSETRLDVHSPQTTGLTSGDWCHFGTGGEMPSVVLSLAAMGWGLLLAESLRDCLVRGYESDFARSLPRSDQRFFRGMWGSGVPYRGNCPRKNCPSPSQLRKLLSLLGSCAHRLSEVVCRHALRVTPTRST